MAQQAAAQQQQAEAAQQQQAASNAGGAPAAAPPRQSARNSGSGPLFTLAAAAKGGTFQPPPPQSGFLRPQQLRYDATALVQSEYRRLLERRAAERRQQIEEVAAGPAREAAAPGFRYRSHQVRGRGRGGGLLAGWLASGLESSARAGRQPCSVEAHPVHTLALPLALCPRCPSAARRSSCCASSCRRCRRTCARRWWRSRRRWCRRVGLGRLAVCRPAVDGAGAGDERAGLQCSSSNGAVPLPSSTLCCCCSHPACPVLQMNERRYKNLLRSHRTARIETARKARLSWRPPFWRP